MRRLPDVQPALPKESQKRKQALLILSALEEFLYAWFIQDRGKVGAAVLGQHLLGREVSEEDVGPQVIAAAGAALLLALRLKELPPRVKEKIERLKVQFDEMKNCEKPKLILRNALFIIQVAIISTASFIPFSHYIQNKTLAAVIYSILMVLGIPSYFITQYQPQLLSDPLCDLKKHSRAMALDALISESTFSLSNALLSSCIINALLRSFSVSPLTLQITTPITFTSALIASHFLQPSIAIKLLDRQLKNPLNSVLSEINSNQLSFARKHAYGLAVGSTRGATLGWLIHFLVEKIGWSDTAGILMAIFLGLSLTIHAVIVHKKDAINDFIINSKNYRNDKLAFTDFLLNLLMQLGPGLLVFQSSYSLLTDFSGLLDAQTSQVLAAFLALENALAHSRHFPSPIVSYLTELLKTKSTLPLLGEKIKEPENDGLPRGSHDPFENNLSF